jgi:CRP-like cAMP-binding protein
MAIDLDVFQCALPYLGFEPSDWDTLAKILREERFPEETVLFSEGERGDGVYFVRSGQVTILRRVHAKGRPKPVEQVLAVLDAGQVFGEMALIEGDTRSADAVCEEGTALYHLGGAEYQALKRDLPHTALRLQDLLVVTLISRLRATRVQPIRAEIPMALDLSIFKDAQPYRGFKAEDWKVLAETLVEERASAGKSLFHEGDPGDGLYFVRSGHVKILRRVQTEGRKDEQQQLLTVLGAGHLFGEMALIEGDTRSADAVTDEEAVLYHLSGTGYILLKRDHPETAVRLQDLVVNTLCARLRAANKNFEIIKFWLT